MEIELSTDSVDALFRTYGINALNRLHEDIECEMPNTTFQCARLTLWLPKYMVVAGLKRIEVWGRSLK